MKTRNNERLFRQASKVIPGGVNSPVRAFKSVGAKPIFIEKARGAILFDADDNRYIDYCLSWGPMILGHANRAVLDEVRKVMSRGTSYGIPTRLETTLAEMIVAAVESIDKVRLVSSGTEAVMTAIRLARGVTGRDKIIKFAGCYHGHVDHMLVQAGSGLTTLGTPSSPGVPADFAKHTLLAPYNDPEAVEKLFDRHGEAIAAVIVEPVAGNMGVVPATGAFLKRLRRLCNKNKSLLIFDEVITLGKIIGGGFPIGAIGGRAAVMKHLSPEGAVYQAGTLSGNPVCVAAGIATLRQLKATNPYPRLEAMTIGLCTQIGEILNAMGIEHTINQVGSMFTLFFNPRPVTDYDTATKSDTKKYAAYFTRMLEAGIYLPPSQFEANFLSTAHTETHINKTLAAIRKLRL